MPFGLQPRNSQCDGIFQREIVRQLRQFFVRVDAFHRRQRALLRAVPAGEFEEFGKIGKRPRDDHIILISRFPGLYPLSDNCDVFESEFYSGLP